VANIWCNIDLQH